MTISLIQDPSKEHPLDVLICLQEFAANNHKVAIAVVTHTEGGGVRTPGALMAICSTGAYVGYVSGGCVDADVARQGIESIQSGTPREVHYGKGSVLTDLPLPCGGAIKVSIIPNPNLVFISRIVNQLRSRKTTHVIFSSSDGLQLQEGTQKTPDRDLAEVIFQTTYLPKLRIRVAGRGADFNAFARIASACGFELVLQTPDLDLLTSLDRHGRFLSTRLKTPQFLPPNEDDTWTAFVLMFHDAHWEAPLLMDALKGDAFYVGAVGSRSAHAARTQVLFEHGCAKEDIARIHAPIGLVPAMRNASGVVVSALAEIIDNFRKITT